MVTDTAQSLARVSVWFACLCTQDLVASIDTIEAVVVHMKNLCESFVAALEDPLQHMWVARMWFERPSPSEGVERLSRRI